MALGHPRRDGTDAMGATPTRGERTRGAVVAAARVRFAASGFDGATIASIASDAGVSEPTVAFHFGNKAGLLVAVVEDHYAGLLAELEQAVDVAAPPTQRLGAFARWWVGHLAEHHDLLQVFGRHGRRTEVDEVVEAFRAGNRRVTREFDRLLADLSHAGALRSGVGRRIVRDTFFGAAEHLLLGWATTGRPADLATAADDLVDLLLHGVGPPSGRSDTGAIADDLAAIEARLAGLDERIAALDASVQGLGQGPPRQRSAPRSG